MTEPAALQSVCPRCQHPAWGIEIPEAYDGVLFWSCPYCHEAWPRFTEGRLAEASAHYAEFYRRDDVEAR